VQPYDVLHERLDRQQVVILDGGIGSELVRRGVRWRDHGLRTDRAAVQALHEEYLDAGAHVLRTNTFQLNRRVYDNVFRDQAHQQRIGAPDLVERVPRLLSAAVELARAGRDSAQRPDVPIAGVMSPLEHCFRPDLTPLVDQARAEHAEIAGLLANAGVDLLLLESMNSLAEARCAVEAARCTGLPVWVSFVVGATGEVLSGESLSEAAKMVGALGAEVVLVNCAPPEDISCAIDTLSTTGQTVFGGCAHIGWFDPPSWKFEFFPQFVGTESCPPRSYATVAASWRTQGARVIGGCCGTGPDHIRALVETIA
jgi:S-methylmethionine-dependent homocysteine/selenocysteine methylase